MTAVCVVSCSICCNLSFFFLDLFIKDSTDLSLFPASGRTSVFLFSFCIQLKVQSPSAEAPQRLRFHKHPRCLHFLRRWLKDKGSNSSSGSCSAFFFLQMSGQPVTKVWHQSHLSHGHVLTRSFRATMRWIAGAPVDCVLVVGRFKNDRNVCVCLCVCVCVCVCCGYF